MTNKLLKQIDKSRTISNDDLKMIVLSNVCIKNDFLD
jgi:hypothetical protein